MDGPRRGRCIEEKQNLRPRLRPNSLLTEASALSDAQTHWPNSKEPSRCFSFDPGVTDFAEVVIGSFLSFDPRVRSRVGVTHARLHGDTHYLFIAVGRRVGE